MLSVLKTFYLVQVFCCGHKQSYRLNLKWYTKRMKKLNYKLCFFILYTFISDPCSLERKSMLEGSEWKNQLPRHKQNPKATAPCSPQEEHRAQPEGEMCCWALCGSSDQLPIRACCQELHLNTWDVWQKNCNWIGLRQARLPSCMCTPEMLTRLVSHSSAQIPTQGEEAAIILLMLIISNFSVSWM